MSSKAGIFKRFSTDKEKALKLFGPVLRPQNPSQLAQEFPLVFSPGSKGEVRVLFEGEQALSGAAFLVREAILHPEGKLSIGAIGSVSTDPNYRGRGLASEVLLQCEKDLADAGCSLALLWAPSPKLYQNNGYIEIGMEIDFFVSAESIVHQPNLPGVVLPLDVSADLESCWELYQSHSARVNRTREEFSQLLTAPGMELFIHKRIGKIQAYGAVGKGADFKETMHEWAGDPQGVLAIVQHYLRQNAREGMGLVCSGASKEFIQYFTEKNYEALPGFLGMIKLLNIEKLLEDLSPVLKTKFHLKCKAGKTVVHLKGPKGSLDFPFSDFLRLLFGYRGVGGDGIVAAKTLGIPEFKQDIPFHLFFWGLDSV